MFELGGVYTKQDLVDVFHTDRMDSIKRSLDRAGYKYETNKKNGKNLRLTITAIPGDPFKTFCVDKLGIPAQSDFRILKTFFYYFFCDEEFQQLPDEEAVRVLEDMNKKMCRQTIAKWRKFLLDKNIVVESNCEYMYFVSFTIEGIVYTEKITRELYLAAIKEYWDVKKSGGSWDECSAAMRKVSGGKVFKKAKIEENGFYNELIDALVKTMN